MSRLKPWVTRLNRISASRLGIVVARTRQLYPWQIAPQELGPLDPATTPTEAASYLRPDHPRLSELRSRYAVTDARVTVPFVWDADNLSPRDLLHFRGDNPFVWQVRGRDRNELTYALCYYHLRSTDADNLLTQLDEDALFGAHVFEIDGRLVSRDLLDSVREIQFLRDNLGIDEGTWNILDIGAGYGRLAHRLSETGGDGLHIFASDAYAPSTFVCEYYLRFRKAERATVVPLDEVEALLAAKQIDLATNIHSFSECTHDAIAWWVERLAANGVAHLLVVPNEVTSGGTRCQTNDGRNMDPIFKRFGYRRVAQEPRYVDPLVQRYGVDPVHLHLFRLG